MKGQARAVLAQSVRAKSREKSKERAEKQDKIPFAIYQQMRQDLDFANSQLRSASSKVEELQKEVMSLTKEKMEFQLSEKDLQSLLTADKIHKQIFMERDQANLKLKEAQEVLQVKNDELTQSIQNNKLLEWNLTEFDADVKATKASLECTTQQYEKTKQKLRYSEQERHSMTE